jgi:hypothetical protein
MGVLRLHMKRLCVIGYVVAFLGVSFLTLRAVCNRPLPSVVSAESQEELLEALNTPTIYSLTPITSKRAPEGPVIIRGGGLGVVLALVLFVLSCGGGWMVLLRGRRGIFWKYVGIVLACLSLMLSGALAQEGANMLLQPECQVIPLGEGRELSVSMRGKPLFKRQLVAESDLRIVCYYDLGSSGATTRVAFVWSKGEEMEGVLLRSFDRPSKGEYFASRLARVSGLPWFFQKKGEDAELLGDMTYSCPYRKCHPGSKWTLSK